MINHHLAAEGDQGVEEGIHVPASSSSVTKRVGHLTYIIHTCISDAGEKKCIDNFDGMEYTQVGGSWWEDDTKWNLWKWKYVVMFWTWSELCPARGCAISRIEISSYIITDCVNPLFNCCSCNVQHTEEWVVSAWHLILTVSYLPKISRISSVCTLHAQRGRQHPIAFPEMSWSWQSREKNKSRTMWVLSD